MNETQNPYKSPNSFVEKEHDKTIPGLTITMKLLNISLLLMVLIYAGIYALSAQNTAAVYVVVPFVLAFWVAVVKLSWIAYGPVMGIVAVLAILLPPGLFVIMLLSYTRITYSLKENGLKLSLMGDVIKK